MKIVKGPSGFGDNIYMRVVMEWLIKNRPNKYTILTNYPDVFFGLNINIKPYHTKNLNIDYNYTYIHHKESKYTQWQDLIFYGGLPDFPLISVLKNRKLSNAILANLPYNAMNGGNMAKTMKPNYNEYMSYIKTFNNVRFIDKQYFFQDLIKIFNSAKLVISQVGWAVPLAEMLDVPLIIIFTKRALNSEYEFISTIKPYKIKSKLTTQIKIME